MHFIREYDFQKIDGRGGIIRILPNICDGAFLQKQLAAIIVSYFQKKILLRIFDRVLNTPLDGYPFPSYRWNITVGKLLNVGMAFVLLYFTKNLKIFQ